MGRKGPEIHPHHSACLQVEQVEFEHLKQISIEILNCCKRSTMKTGFKLPLENVQESDSADWDA